MAPEAAMPAGIPHISPQTINAIRGKTPSKSEEIAFWIAQKANQLEAIDPHTTPQDKCRILTICLPIGMVPSTADCDN